jgi:hypothetical protein
MVWHFKVFDKMVHEMASWKNNLAPISNDEQSLNLFDILFKVYFKTSCEILP